MSLFFLASAGCAVSWDTMSIIGFRALQGAGAALMMPVSALGVAVIGGVTLALGPALPGRAGTAESIAAGFGAAAAAFALAIVAGALLLGRTRSTSAAT